MTYGVTVQTLDRIGGNGMTMLLVDAANPYAAEHRRPQIAEAEVPLHRARRPRSALPRLHAERAVPHLGRLSRVERPFASRQTSPDASQDPHAFLVVPARSGCQPGPVAEPGIPPGGTSSILRVDPERLHPER